MGPDLLLLVLRLALVVGLYLFLFFVALVISRDLGRGGRMIRGDAPRNARLVVVAAGPEVNILREEFPLDSQATIGRDTTNDISFPDDFISVRHALVTWSDNRWWIEDQGSTNGTTVNDRPIKSRVPIGPNDVIGVGRVRLRLSTD